MNNKNKRQEQLWYYPTYSFQLLLPFNFYFIVFYRKKLSKIVTVKGLILIIRLLYKIIESHILSCSRLYFTKDPYRIIGIGILKTKHPYRIIEIGILSFLKK